MGLSRRGLYVGQSQLADYDVCILLGQILRCPMAFMDPIGPVLLLLFLWSGDSVLPWVMPPLRRRYPLCLRLGPVPRKLCWQFRLPILLVRLSALPLYRWTVMWSWYVWHAERGVVVSLAVQGIANTTKGAARVFPVYYRSVTADLLSVVPVLLVWSETHL